MQRRENPKDFYSKSNDHTDEESPSFEDRQPKKQRQQQCSTCHFTPMYLKVKRSRRLWGTMPSTTGYGRVQATDREIHSRAKKFFFSKADASPEHQCFIHCNVCTPSGLSATFSHALARAACRRQTQGDFTVLLLPQKAPFLIPLLPPVAGAKQLLRVPLPFSSGGPPHKGFTITTLPPLPPPPPPSLPSPFFSLLPYILEPTATLMQVLT